MFARSLCSEAAESGPNQGEAGLTTEFPERSASPFGLISHESVTMLLTLVSAGLAFQAPAISRTAARQGAVSMSESIGRRELLVQGSSFAASLALLAGSPAASWADGANSKQQARRVARVAMRHGGRMWRPRAA